MSGSSLQVFAAGSLRVVMPALARAFTAASGIEVVTQHGPAGLMRERIEGGERPDLFMSADLGHPARLAELGLAGAPTVFARNRVVALVHREAGIDAANLVDRLLEPAVAIGTSTPLKDPSGDYAWAIFRRIEALRPGAYALLDAKARKLVGGALPAATANAYSPVAQALESRTVDVFLGYVTGLRLLAAESAHLEVLGLPPEVEVVPEYALAIIAGASPQASCFQDFVMSAAGQELIAAAGFVPAS